MTPIIPYGWSIIDGNIDTSLKKSGNAKESQKIIQVSKIQFGFKMLFFHEVNHRRHNPLPGN